MKLLCEVPIKDKTLTELDVSGKRLGTEGALVVAEYLRDNGALSCEDGTLYDPTLPAGWTKHFDEQTKMAYYWNGQESTWSKPKGAGDGVCSHCGKRKVDHRAKGALSSLNLAANNLGELVLPEGWTEDWDYDDEDEIVYKHTDGRTQKEHPGKPDGIIAIAKAIPDMRAMTSLNLASNHLGIGGAKIIADSLGLSTRCAICAPHSAQCPGH
jgi:hypothetical protein